MDEAQYLEQARALWRAAWPAGVPRDVRYPHGVIALSDYLREWARVQPKKAAVIFYGLELTYGELDRLSDRFAGLLASLGVAKGDRVAVFLPNCPQFHIAFFGILKLGAVHVPVSPQAKAFELQHQVSDSGAEVILTLDQLYPLVAEVKAATALRQTIVTRYADMLPIQPALPTPRAFHAPPVACPGAIDLMTALEEAREYPAQAASLDDLAALNYTGGTTGLPKGCMHTQGDMIYTAATNASLAPADAPEARPLAFLQEYWIAGQNACLLYPVFSGTTLVLLSRWDPVAVMMAVDRYKVTTTGMPVDAALELIDHPRFAEFDLTSLRRIRVMSFVKKLTAEHRARWRAATGTIVSEAAWGMTETHTADTFTLGMQDDDYDLKAQPTFCGIPVRGTDIKICDFDTGEILPPGAKGEICCRSPSVMKGYWGKPQATAETLRGGWLHSGDIGVIDEAGYLHYLGRNKEMIKVKGMSVFPAEIETVLGQHPSVEGSAVVPRSDPDRGQVPVAFVMLKAGDALGPDDIVAWCRERLAGYKTPEVQLVEALPLTTSGKVRKSDLAKLVEA